MAAESWTIQKLMLHVIIAWCTLATLLVRACTKNHFREYEGHYSNATVLFSEERSLQVSKCTRICRMVSECWGFNVRWSDSNEKKNGSCEFLGAYRGGLVRDGNYSFYVSCPDGMTHYKATDRCYQYVDLAASWQGAQTYCRDLYPQAHLIEIHDAFQQQMMIRLALNGLDTSAANQECRVTELGTYYRGILNTTVSGLPCQRWDSNSPHWHLYDYWYPWLEEEANYCRNPSDYYEGLWCYTQDPNTDWELCSVPLCTGGNDTWLGGKRHKNAGIYDVIWRANFDDVTGYSVWAATEPSGHPQNCLLAASSANYMWQDVNCWDKHSFICQF